METVKTVKTITGENAMKLVKHLQQWIPALTGADTRHTLLYMLEVYSETEDCPGMINDAIRKIVPIIEMLDKLEEYFNNLKD